MSLRILFTRFRAIGPARRLAACLLCGLAAICPLGAAKALADVFVLKNDGQVRGELVNKDENPRTTYQVRTPSGGVITLDAAEVVKSVHQSALEMEYDRVRLKVGDSVDDQWRLAEWCREKHLDKQRKTHLEQVIAMDPEHAGARRGLGFSHIGGKWVTQSQKMAEDGYVKTEEGWKLPQEVEINNVKNKQNHAETEWFQKLKRWRGWLDIDSKAGTARGEIAAIDDPYATRALAESLTKEEIREVRQLYIDALARIGTPGAMHALTNAALFDPDEESRMSCLDLVVRKQYKPAAGVFIGGLKNADNGIVNRAGLALGQLRDPSAIGPLIDALVTTHKFEVQKGGSPGQMTSTFGSGPGMGGGGFTFGNSGPVIEKRQIPNSAVLTALISLTNVNFDYDTHAWKYWYASKKKPTTMDVRRD